MSKTHDRLQPALLDRLRDDDPASSQESPAQGVVTRSQLREAVLRDLSWLFNTSRPSGLRELDGYPHARRSVLNYGMPVLSGQTMSSVDAVSLQAQVRQAIVEFEPRILADTLRVEVIISNLQADHHNQISFRISGQLWAQPVPLELLLRSDVDLETGHVELRDLVR